MRTFLAAAAVTLGMLVSGCGGGEESGSPSTAADTTTTAESDADPSLTEFAGPEQDVIDAGHEYFIAIGTKDWAGVCDAVTERTRSGLERATGLDCEQAVQVLYDSPQFENFGEVYGSAPPKSVKVTGDRAEVDFFGDDDPLTAVMEDGEWRLDLD